MAFYIRKAVSYGPIRFDLSKIGIGTLIDNTGFRVGIRPNGKSYLYAGQHGFGHKEELKNVKNKRVPKQTSFEKTKSIDVTRTTKYNTASSKELAPQSRKELLEKLNSSYKSFRLDYLCGVIFIIISFIGFKTSNTLGIAMLIIGIAATIYVSYWESKRRTVVITYDFEDGKAEHFQKIIKAFNFLTSNKCVWSLIDSKNVSGTHESKLNAGAGDLVNKDDVQIGEGKPPWVETNISVPVIIVRGQALYMMPDGILVYDDKGVGFVEYNDISFDTETIRFIDEKPSSDARIVDKTWKHPNKDGGPDRRFRDNFEIPVCLYGKLKIKSTSGLFIYLMTSKHDTPSKFKTEFKILFS